MGIKVGMVSLGCDKNRINAEQMLGRLADAGYEIAATPEEARVVIINTCAFIESAKAEAIDSILEIAAFKKDGPGGSGAGIVEKIIVTGCLAERYKDEIFREIPEVDGLAGTGSFADIVSVVDSVLEGKKAAVFGDPDSGPDEFTRFLTDPRHYAYIKVAEGCDNRCSYCIIPDIRGKYRSRRMENILSEGKDLADSGAKELILVAQDLTRYGLDLYGRRALPELLTKLCGIGGIKWIRLHYLYPEEITDELIRTIKSHPKILRYLDIPIQHINDGILRNMNRRSDSISIRALLKKIRREIDGACIRTSMIVGFPGEGEEEFEELCDFLREEKLERAGFFAFSPEEGTPAYDLPGAPDEDEVKRRLEVLADIQYGIMEEYNKNCIDKVFGVICDGFDPVAGRWFGRTYADSPGIDGRVFFSSEDPLGVGEMVEVLIEGSLDGDLYGRALQ